MPPRAGVVAWDPKGTEGRLKAVEPFHCAPTISEWFKISSSVMTPHIPWTSLLFFPLPFVLNKPLDCKAPAYCCTKMCLAAHWFYLILFFGWPTRQSEESVLREGLYWLQQDNNDLIQDGPLRIHNGLQEPLYASLLPLSLFTNQRICRPYFLSLLYPGNCCTNGGNF